MPYMQRLTWYGVALHAGNLPGYPASHGCIRLPKGFAKLLYGTTSVGMTVVISRGKATPRIAAGPQIVAPSSIGSSTSDADFVWTPEKSPQGPVSIVISSADRKAMVLRNGVEIGSAPVMIDGAVEGTWAYTLRDVDSAGQHWIRVSLASSSATGDTVPREEWRRFHAPEGFKQMVAAVVRPGTTVVVTSDSLVSGAVATPVTVIDAGSGVRTSTGKDER
jgi:hypothetical protein